LEAPSANSDANRARLAPVYDVITTTLYPYDRAGVRVVDRTMALKLRQGDRRIERIAEGMEATLEAARHDDRIPSELREQLSNEWRESIFAYQIATVRSTSRSRVRRAR
jgi:hypothetical protein